MPMIIRQIRESIPFDGYTNTFNVDQASISNPHRYLVPTYSIRAVEFANLQMYAFANNTQALVKVRNQTLVNGSGFNGFYICEYGFTVNLEPTNISTTFYPTSTSAQRDTFRLAISNLSSNKYFTIVASGINTLTQSEVDSLFGIDALYAEVKTNQAFSFVAVGYNKKVIDSMWNGNNRFAASQVYVNGQNKSIGATIKASASVNTTSLPYQGGSLVSVTLPDAIHGYRYYQIEFATNTNIDYIIFQHNKGELNDFIIENHHITVVDSSGNEIYVQQPSNSVIETKYGTRYYVFGQIGVDTVITGGFESSISMAGTNAAINRLAGQQAYSAFADTVYSSTFNSSLYSKFDQFSNQYPQESTAVETKIERADIEPIIKNAEQIKYGIATCNAGCSAACFSSSCTVTCTNTCGVRCGNSCSSECDTQCGFTNCANVCIGNTCIGTCGGACYGGCAAACAGGTCGSSCTATCSAVCGGSCASNCSSTCYGRCTSIAAWCTNCYDGCGGTCAANGCKGTCASACYGYTCGNNCGSSCGSGCYTTCGSLCVNKCSSGCSTNLCISNCTYFCSNNCMIVCSNTCTTSCSTSCTGTCISAASNGKPAYI